MTGYRPRGPLVSVADRAHGLREVQPHRFRMADDRDIGLDVLAVTEPEANHVLLVERHQGIGGERGLHGRSIADRGDR